MKRVILICITTFVFLIACNKKKDDNTSTVVVYQVTATNSTKIDITYNNALGNKIIVTAKDSWTFEIDNPVKPFNAYVQAVSSSPFSSVTTSCTATILVNGSIVKTIEASSNTSATAEAESTIQ